MNPRQTSLIFLFAAAILASVAIVDVRNASASAFPGGNGKIAFSGPEGITLVNPDGSDPTVLTATTGIGARFPDWSPDGTRIVFVGNPNSSVEQIFVINADGTGMQQLTSVGPSIWPKWSPDGSQIVFVRGPDLFAMNADGSGETALTAAGNLVPGSLTWYVLAADNPNWSPDGTRIVFWAYVLTELGAECNLWTLHGGGAWTRLTTSDLSTIRPDACYPDLSPSWSPDGTKIVFDRYEPSGHYIRTMNANGSDMTPRLTEGGLDVFPAWSPDGSRIAFLRNGDVFTMNLDGTDLTPITNDHLNSALSWQPLTGAAPTITSANAATFTVGAGGTFTVTTTGSPAAGTIAETGALPSGVTFTNNGDGTATLAGTPDDGTGGSYPLTIAASNGIAPDATQSFTLTVNEPVTPVITWADPADITYGVALGAGQLNAGTGVAGSFEYTPSAGVVLSAGVAQALTVTFTPDDPVAYTQATKIVHINVLRAPLTVTASGATKVFGAPLPPLSATIDGLVNGDTPGSVGAPVVLTTSATPSSPVGAYPIVPSGIASPNYDVTFVSGTLTIVPGTTTTALLATPSSVGLLQPITLKATVGVIAPAVGLPGGNVQFFDGATLLGSAPLSGATATLVINGLASGVHALSSVYAGDASFTSSTSPSAAVTVQSAAASTFTLAVPLNNPAAFGQPVVLVALVVPIGGGVSPTGTVYFIDGTTLTLLGSGTVGASGLASISVTTLGVGPHLILAYYAGSATLAASLSPVATVVVYSGPPPTLAAVALSATPNPSPLGQPVALRATLTAPAGSPAGTVYFLSDGALIGSGVVTNVGGVFTAEMTTSTLSRGVHVVSALYAGGGSFGMSVSPPFILAVP